MHESCSEQVTLERFDKTFHGDDSLYTADLAGNHHNKEYQEAA